MAEVAYWVFAIGFALTLVTTPILGWLNFRERLRVGADAPATRAGAVYRKAFICSVAAMILCYALASVIDRRPLP